MLICLDQNLISQTEKKHWIFIAYESDDYVNFNICTKIYRQIIHSFTDFEKHEQLQQLKFESHTQ